MGRRRVAGTVAVLGIVAMAFPVPGFLTPSLSAQILSAQTFAASTAPAKAVRILKVAPEGVAAGRDRFPDLASALARAARLRREGSAIVVELEPGTHRLERPVRIGPELAGTAEYPLVIRGAPDGSSRLTGSRPLRPAPLPDDLRARLPEAARQKVRAYRLPPPWRPRRSSGSPRCSTTRPPRHGGVRPDRGPAAGPLAERGLCGDSRRRPARPDRLRLRDPLGPCLGAGDGALGGGLLAMGLALGDDPGRGPPRRAGGSLWPGCPTRGRVRMGAPPSCMP